MEKNIVASDSFEQYLISHPFTGKPENLYNAMNYIMQIGGKRLRPRLLLLSYLCVKNVMDEDANQLALAIEVFHNFSLVHDDIIDNAPKRRNRNTVHVEWDINTAILAGDNLLIECYDMILGTDYPNKAELLKEFTKMAREVCEGQIMDLNLPKFEHVSEQEYLHMIHLKTAVLPALALKMGAIAAGAEAEVTENFYQFGYHLGMAFQLQDDYLDVFGEGNETGKIEGGDILENKRTLLYMYAIENLKDDEKQELSAWYNDRTNADAKLKVIRVRELFKKAGSDNYLLSLKSDFEEKARHFLELSCPESPWKEEIRKIFDFLITRKH